MHRRNSNIIKLPIFIFICCDFLFSSCANHSSEGMIVFTQTKKDVPTNNSDTENNRFYGLDSRIVAINPDSSDKTIKVLTEGFYSAGSPEISYDGKSMIFAGQKNQNDVWQIWELNLKNLKIRQITDSPENCIDPTYLPGNRFAFSKITKDNSAKVGYALYTCNLDGSDISKITFNPHTYSTSRTLKDGRILTNSRQLLPEEGEKMLMVLRPDGSKQELFYQSPRGNELLSSFWETSGGKVIFIESNVENKGNIISINYSRPLNSRVNLTSGLRGSFLSVGPSNENKFLAVYRATEEEHYGLYEFDRDNKTLGKAIYQDENYNVLEAVAVRKKERPKKLPSEVNMSVKTGLLLCQDINFSDIQPEENSTSSSKAVKMEVLGIDTSLGIMDVEKDGSFYLKILADTPFRIQTIDENGNIVNGPGSWLYVRPNERRGCVGCHEDREQVPLNRQALSVNKEPVILPMHLKEIQKQQAD